MLRYVLVLTVCSSLTALPWARADISPADAIAAVRQFCGDPGLPVSLDLATGVDGRSDAGLFSYHGDHYNLRVEQDEWAGEYAVRAANGEVFAVRLDAPPVAEPFAVTMQQAQATAEQFARQHCAIFDQQQWRLIAENVQDGYEFAWLPILSAQGTLGGYGVDVEVHGMTGLVTHYVAPLIRVVGPVVPQIALAQALVLAVPFALYNPAEVPFTNNTLNLEDWDDTTGEQRLVWRLSQYPDPVNLPGWSWCVAIDAITGECVGGGGPLSAPPKPPRAKTRPIPRPILVTGRLAPRISGAVVKDGAVWLRVEGLRAFGAQVDVGKEGARVRRGDRTFTGAVRRDYGWWTKVREPVGIYNWWVPVRKAADALGWQVEWHAADHRVVLLADAAGPAAGATLVRPAP